MTRDQVDSVQGDIAYLKQLATEGRDAPVLVGPILVAASIIFGIPSLFQWGVVTGVLTVNPWAILGVWVFAGVVFAGVLTMIIRKIDMQKGSETIKNRTIAAAWSACGYSIFVGWLALMAYGFSTGSWAPMSLMPTLVMIAYGSAWLIAGLIVERRWMVGVGLLSYAGAVALAWFANTHLVFGVYILLLLAVALSPGLYLMRQNRDQLGRG